MSIDCTGNLLVAYLMMLLFFSLLVFLRSLRISMIINQTKAEYLLPEGKLFSVLEPFKIRSMGIWRIGGGFNCLFRQSDQIFLYLARIHQFYAKWQIPGCFAMKFANTKLHLTGKRENGTKFCKINTIQPLLCFQN